MTRSDADQPSGPTSLRRAAQGDDVRIVSQAVPYKDFFAVQETHLTHQRFDGTQSAVIKRAAFVSGDAVTVLPVDPIRKRVLLVEQFRMGPFARGDRQPWSLEAIAGRIDAGESPETAARREAMEEAGITLGAMRLIAAYYPSPGAVTEYLYSYIAICDLPDDIAGIHGLATEAEDIRSHVISLDHLMELVKTGEVNNAPLILTAFWLAQNPL
jgi:ADP-ribose pyrophosphatase